MSYPMHYHPEIEITFIRKSYGQRFVGDHIEHFNDGDLVMIGRNLPHQWQNDIGFRESPDDAELTVIHFRDDIFEGKLSSIAEFAHIQQLITASSKAVKFSMDAASQLEVLLDKYKTSHQTNDFLFFIEMLNLLAIDEEKEILSSVTINASNQSDSGEKVNDAYSFILKNYQNESLSLSEVAQSIHLSDSAFSHFIKKKTGLTFSELLNDLRIRYAGKLLAETDLRISEICYKVGYKNLSYFNRIFKKLRKTSPMDYRRNFHKTYLQEYENHKDLLSKMK